MEQITLKPYRSVDFGILASWVTDAEILLRFSGPTFTYPITQSQITEYQAQNPERQFYMGYQEKMPVFFGEIIPQEDHVPRLGRLLVGDFARRGKGLGALFTRLMIAECRRLYNSPAVELYTWVNNEAAIKCYKSIGFEFMPVEPYKMVHEGVEYELRKMSVSTEDERLKIAGGAGKQMHDFL